MARLIHTYNPAQRRVAMLYQPADKQNVLRNLGVLAAMALVVNLFFFSASPAATGRAAGSGLDKVNHIIVIYQENWSFDSLYGNFPGANGFANDASTVGQVDKAGQPDAVLPQPID